MLFDGTTAIGVVADEAPDVIFLDPPFTEDPWSWLVPACEARLAPGGFLYAEAPRELVPPAPFAVFRHARAGLVHYHLLRHNV